MNGVCIIECPNRRGSISIYSLTHIHYQCVITVAVSSGYTTTTITPQFSYSSDTSGQSSDSQSSCTSDSVVSSQYISSSVSSDSTDSPNSPLSSQYSSSQSGRSNSESPSQYSVTSVNGDTGGGTNTGNNIMFNLVYNYTCTMYFMNYSLL